METGDRAPQVEVPLEGAAGRDGASGLDVTATLTFSDLYRAEFLPLVRLATLLIGRPEAARDVVQDAFVGLHVRWSTVRDPLAYVRRSVVNGCRSHHRAGARRPQVPLGDHEPPTSLAADDQVDHTLATLDRLSPRERACVVLKFYEDRTETEIAALVGCRPGSVGPTVHRALAKLRNEE